MTTRLCQIFSLAALAAPLVLAQQGSISGPTSGFVFDNAAHAVRPVLGVPGASSIGDPVSLGFNTAAVYLAPRQDSALAVAADQSLHLLRLNAGAPGERTVDGLSTVPEKVAFSPTGAAVALYSAGKVQIFNGLPDSPALAGSLDLGGSPSAFTVSDDGAFILFASGGSIRLVGTAGANRKLMDSGDGAMVAFAANSHDAAVSDPNGAGLVLFRDLTGSTPQTVVAAPDDGTASPVGLAFSADGHKLFLASSSAQSVAAFDLDTGDRQSVACDCTLTGLAPMGSLFRVNELGSGPLWLFAGNSKDLQMVFVPALVSAAAN